MICREERGEGRSSFREWSQHIHIMVGLVMAARDGVFVESDTIP